MHFSQIMMRMSIVTVLTRETACVEATRFFVFRYLDHETCATPLLTLTRPKVALTTHSHSHSHSHSTEGRPHYSLSLTEGRITRRSRLTPHCRRHHSTEGRPHCASEAALDSAPLVLQILTYRLHSMRSPELATKRTRRPPESLNNDTPS
ncbi:Unannotated [Lentimonas sp. CC11]|nr:Unannotated [Lentimonas sp. CC11]